MKSQQNFWKSLAADWKLAALVAFPMFGVAMWFGISRGYEDIGLYAIVMALGTLHVGEMVIVTVRRFREWRRS
jgi:hypothetical protein